MKTMRTLLAQGASSSRMRARAAIVVLIGTIATAAINAAAVAFTPPTIPLPSPPKAALRRVIGEYGEPASALTIYEKDGALFADGRGLHESRVGPHSELHFEFTGAAHATAVTIAGERLRRRDFGQEAVARIRAGARSDAVRLRRAALAASPPHEAAPRRPSELVDLAGIDPSIKFDIRYATAKNFMGFALYERRAAYLQRPAAEALRRVVRALAPSGYGLLVYDGYRPWFVTQMFWEATPAAAHIFVADPAVGSRHNRGCAVDLSLYALATGEPVQMTGRYDEMSLRSFPDFVGGTSRQRWLRDLLRQAMEANGFTVYEEEWWHYDYGAWQDYGIGNIPFERLADQPADGRAT